MRATFRLRIELVRVGERQHARPESTRQACAPTPATLGSPRRRILSNGGPSGTQRVRSRLHVVRVTGRFKNGEKYWTVERGEREVEVREWKECGEAGILRGHSLGVSICSVKGYGWEAGIRTPSPPHS
jgi:hypothetical protein